MTPVIERASASGDRSLGVSGETGAAVAVAAGAEPPATGPVDDVAVLGGASARGSLELVSQPSTPTISTPSATLAFCIAFIWLPLTCHDSTHGAHVEFPAELRCRGCSRLAAAYS